MYYHIWQVQAYRRPELRALFTLQRRRLPVRAIWGGMGRDGEGWAEMGRDGGRGAPHKYDGGVPPHEPPRPKPYCEARQRHPVLSATCVY